MKIREIDTVCFVGAGTMGCFNALMASTAGYQAVMYDVSAEVLNSSPQRLEEMAGYLVGDGFLAREAISEALARITVNSDLSAATADADLVSESVSERLEIKREVHRRLDTVCSPSTLITTNTSSILVSQIEDVLARGDRFAALHSHLGSSLIDIVGGPRTSAQTIDVLERYVVSIQGMPLVLKKENPGYVLNAILGPLLAVSKILAIEGIATLEDVDRAWMLHQDAPIGPFGLMDLFGLDIISDSWQQPKPGRAHLRDKVLSFITPYIDKNTLGLKSGAGFYAYPQPEYQQESFLEGHPDLMGISQVLICTVIAHAIVIADNDVADPVDIDRAWTTSMTLEQGPFDALEAMGVEVFLASCASYLEKGLFSTELVEQAKSYLLA